ncbi:MAG TPA: TetR/AcrR family transcriptional regulator [Bryobacteraceae bacterium]|jgi:AcrR family transcriptional regulator|nr:TetR/AcrR family transcriptional regulator [Bryobacteraceae bacterium]
MARTRSIRAHEDVLNAALELIAARGIDVTSMDAIADASGVSKATIYKYWPTKEALCLEAIGSVNGELPPCDSGDARADLIQILRHVAQKRNSGPAAKLWPRVIGHAAGNPAFRDALKARFDEPRRAQIKRLIADAIERGQLRPDVDTDLAMDLLVGPVMHRCFCNTVIPADLPERVVGAFWKAWGTESGAVSREVTSREVPQQLTAYY